MVLRYRAEDEEEVTPPKPRTRERGTPENSDRRDRVESGQEFASALTLREQARAMKLRLQAEESEGGEGDGTRSLQNSKEFLPMEIQRPQPPAESRPGSGTGAGGRPSSKKSLAEANGQRSKDLRKTISRMISIQRLSTRKALADIEADHLRDYLTFLYRKAEQLLLWEKLDAKISKAAGEERKPVIELCSRASFSQMKSLRTSCFENDEDLDRSELDEDFSPDQITSSAQLRRFSNTDARVRRQSAFVIQMPQEEPFDETDEDSRAVEGLEMKVPEAASAAACPEAQALGPAASLGPHPLLEAFTRRKVKVQEVRDVLTRVQGNLRLEEPLEPEGKTPLPRALVVAVADNSPELVGLLLEFKADAAAPYEGESNFKGWIKPGTSLLHSVTNRKGRFVGTMLAERLEKVEELLQAAAAAVAQEAPVDDLAARVEEEELSSPSQSRSAFRAISSTWQPGELCRHTQGHPIGVYEILEHLGDGDTSTVWGGWHLESSVSVAIKIEAKSDEGGMWEEIEIMRKLRHPNVCRLFETFESESQVFMVLDLCLGGRLYDVLALDGGQTCRAKRVLKQLADAVACLHAHKISHRDIQLENFLLVELEAPLEEATIRLIDFTTSKDFSAGQALVTKICTPTYVAKEILTRKMEPYTEKVDVWSLGVVFYILFSGHPPFSGDTDFDVLKQVKKGAWSFEPASAWEGAPKEAPKVFTFSSSIVASWPRHGILSAGHGSDPADDRAGVGAPLGTTGTGAPSPAAAAQPAPPRLSPPVCVCVLRRCCAMASSAEGETGREAGRRDTLPKGAVAARPFRGKVLGPTSEPHSRCTAPAQHLLAAGSHSLKPFKSLDSTDKPARMEFER
ncbi:CPK2 [Symbiodinium sp. CCMP2456]|nr:CPK2 [Symbiodinium sp. CCMP2456]